MKLILTIFTLASTVPALSALSYQQLANPTINILTCPKEITHAEELEAVIVRSLALEEIYLSMVETPDPKRTLEYEKGKAKYAEFKKDIKSLRRECSAGEVDEE